MIEPTRAFVVFEENTTRDKMIGKHITVFGSELKIGHSIHPTNVNWKAHGIKRKMPIWLKRVSVLILIAIGTLLYVTFLIWLTQSKIEIDYMKLPPGNDCESRGKGLNVEGQKLYAYYEW